MKTKIETDEKGFEVRANYTHRDHSFGVVDKSGREYGARCAAWEFNMIPATETDETTSWTYSKEPGRYFAFRGQAMRGGKTFGATQPDQMFRDAFSRDAAMAKYLRSAKARAEKVSVGRASFATEAR